jgi:hypothetical protein
MLTRKHFDALAEINAKNLERCDELRQPDESEVAGRAIWRLIADQVRWLRKENLYFNDVKFIAASGVSEDWAVDRIIGWSKE